MVASKTHASANLQLSRTQEDGGPFSTYGSVSVSISNQRTFWRACLMQNKGR